MIYLASPYSHSDIAVREQRFHDVCREAAKLIRTGEVVFSPIAHSHSITVHGLPTDWKFWERHDRRYLACCKEVVVLMLDGWQESEGVQAEIRIAIGLRKPVRYLEPSVATTLARVAKEDKL